MRYRIAFCGLGSIARRHIQNVHAYLDRSGDSCLIDLYRTRLKPLPQEVEPLVSEQYLFEGPVQKDYDMVFVTNPTSMHYATLKKFRNHTKAFFIEKPVFDSTAVDESIFAELQGIDCYVACPLRYHPVLQYVKNKIDLTSVYSARAISSSYLPDWRPGQDYRQCYSAHKDMGGGVAIDLIHEWDYLTWLFEAPHTIYTIQGKISHLEIDSEDVALYIAQTPHTTIELHLDYFGRQPIRQLQLMMPDDTVDCDILNGRILFLKSQQEKHFDSERNISQMAEIEHFFDIITHQVKNDSTPEHAYRVLKIAKGEV